MAPQKVKQTWITDGEYGNMSTRSFIAERTGSKVHQFGAFVCMLIPVLHTGAECIMHISREEDYALQSTYRLEEVLKGFPFQCPCFTVVGIIILDEPVVPDLNGFNKIHPENRSS